MKKTKAFPLLLAMILAFSPMMVWAEDAPIIQPVDPNQPVGPDQPDQPDPEDLVIKFPVLRFYGIVHRLSFKEVPDQVTEVKACDQVELSAIVNIESFETHSAPDAEYEEHGYEANHDYSCNRKNVNEDEYSLLDFRWQYERDIEGTSPNNGEGKDVVIIAPSAETRNTTSEGRKSTVRFKAPAEAGDYKLSVTAGLYDTVAGGTAINGQNRIFIRWVKDEATLRVSAAPPVESVSVTPASAEVAIGETVDLTASVTPDDAVQTVTWSSSDESVATVTDNGRVTAVGPGTCDITAKSSSDATKSAKAVITVKENEEENKDVHVTEITLDPATAKLNPGQTVELKATVSPDNATDKSLTWSSSNTSVATVDENGKVTAVGKGQATIKATSVEDPSISATAAITVEEKKEEEEEEDIPVKKVTLTPAVKTLIPGRIVNLTATVKPADATDKTLTWSSGNKKVATVSKSGKVTAVSPGTTKITVKAGGKKAEATIKVADMKLDTAKLVVKQGSSKTIGGTFVNDKIKSAKVTKDKNKAIEKVTVEKSGKKLKVKAKKGRKGEATIKVTSAAGITQNIKVSVRKDKVTTKKIEILNSSGKAGNSFSVVKGKKITLTIKATPDQVSTGEKPAISKKPDKNTASATINKAGKLVVKGIKKGKTKITVKAGNVRKQITVNVKKK